MLLSTGVELDCPPRFGTPRNLDVPTLGPEVAEIAQRLGRPLMPWQQLVADVATEVDPDSGDFLRREINLAVMRRQGKTALMLPLLIHRCRRIAKLYGEPQKCYYTAQSGKDARRKWEEDHVDAIDRSAYGPLGRARKPGKFGRVKFDNNDPGIFWDNRSSIRPMAPTESGGHGNDADIGVVDEAFAHADDRAEQAYAPAMLTRRSPQLYVISAAGTDRSAYWWPKVRTGRTMIDAGKTDGPRAYFEWSADHENGEPFDDPATWWRRMPALGHTITEAAVAAELRKVLDGLAVDADDENAGDVGLERFLRPYLGVWCRIPIEDHRKAYIDPRAWNACRSIDSTLLDPVVFGVEVTSDRRVAAIVAAGASSQGGTHAELADVIPVADAVRRLGELHERHRSVGVALEASGPAGSLSAELVAHGIPVHEIKARDYQRACADLFDAIAAGTFHHLGNDTLDAASVAAARRNVGDAWVWDRRGGRNDIAALVAATAARWVALTAKPEPVTAASSFVFLGGDDW